MAGRIITNRITQNTIIVTWQIDGCCANGYTQVSTPFTMTSGRYAVPFILSIVCNKQFIIKVQHNTGEVGRAVICLAVTNDSNINAIKVYFSEKWEAACSFSDIGRLPAFENDRTINLATNLKINCKITWLGFVECLTIPELPLALRSIVNVPFDNTVIPDFTIIVEGQELLAHKPILARNSPVLLAMFESPIKESKENKIVIEDIEYSTMEILLRTMYTGESEALNDVDTALAVLEAAEKYQMSMIKSLCEFKLQLRIQTGNVLMLLEKADKYNALQLCETCVAYILALRNHKISCEFRKISQKPNIAIAFVNAFTDQSFLVPIQKQLYRTVSGSRHQ